MKGLFKQCTHSLAFRGKFILPLTGTYYKIGGCPLGIFWSHGATLCFDANHSLLWTALFPRYLFHRGIDLPLIAAITSKVCIFLTISKPLTIQTLFHGLWSAKCFLWWETSVASFFGCSKSVDYFVRTVARCSAIIHMWACTHLDYSSRVIVGSREKIFFFFPQRWWLNTLTYILIWKDLKHWSPKCHPWSRWVWNRIHYLRNC